jgi:uncharacterized protein involved in exopolysaccharide biosynthesis
MHERARIDSDTIDVADVIRTLQREWRAVVSFIVVGVLGAVAILLFAPRQYDGKATVLARATASSGSSVLGRMTGLNELLSGAGGGLGGSMLETELQLLKSRALMGQVVDSLLLQVVVREPRELPAHHIVVAYTLNPSFAPATFSFKRAANGSYSVNGEGVERTVAPGAIVELPVGSLRLSATALPESFELRILDREDAISRLERKLKIAKSGGEIVRVQYRADNALAAAAVPNALSHFYVERRKTVDRGTNARRLEYVNQQVDQTAAELATAERELRRYQESTKMFDAEVYSKAEMEMTGRLRTSLVDLQVDEGAIRQLLAQADKGLVTSRDLAAYPAFIRGSAVSPMVTQLSELEMQRTRLLERRTERDPEVQALDRSMQGINASIVGMARSYAASVSRQRAELQARLDSAEESLRRLPAANEHVGRLQRDVIRLTQLYAALQAQLVEARLGVIGEGGDVRQVDVAAIPKSPAFPEPVFTLGVGTAGGLFAGLLAALVLGWFGRTLRDPADIERVTGVLAHRIRADAPLLVGGTAPRTLLVVPLEARAQPQLVAERLARTASVRGVPVSVLDFTRNGANGASVAHDPAGIAVVRQLDQLEQQHAMLVVQLPELSNELTVAAMRENRPVVLVAPPGPVNRYRLTAALEALRQMQVPCAGIVITDEPERSAARALT